MSCNYALLLHFNELFSDPAPLDSSDNGIVCSYSDVSTRPQSVAPDHFARQSSCYFPSGTSHVTVAPNTAIQLSGQFTIDLWVRFDNAAADSTLFNSGTDGIPLSFKLKLQQIADASYLILDSISSTPTLSSRYYPKTFINNKWYHIAVSRDSSSNIRIFIDGDLLQGGASGGPYTNNTWTINTAYTQTTGMKIGVDGAGGYMDEFRVVNGNAEWNSDFTLDHPIDPHCPIYGCVNPDAFNYDPLADIDNLATSLCVPATYWNKTDMGIVFKASAHDTEGSSTEIKIQAIQRNTWTQVNFRDEGFDTTGQYFPAISTFKPTVAGKYNLQAQIQVQDVLGYELSDVSHTNREIIAAIHHNGTAIEQNITPIEHYYPNDPTEDTTVVVETIVELTEQDILDGNNEFTAHVYIKGVREYKIDDKYNLCAMEIGCIHINADNTTYPAPEGMMYIPPGDFIYGPAGSEETKTTVAFLIDTYEVTAGEYKACVDAGGCSYNGSTTNSYRTYENSKDNHPINYVDWQESVDYCTWKGKRLPTEVEWEKAARGTDGRAYPWGDTIATCDYAVMYEGGLGCGTDSTWEVGQNPQGVSPYGAYDMAGNMAEWTDSWPLSNTSLRLVCGGSFRNNMNNLLSSYRASHSPSQHHDFIGFRCAQDSTNEATIDDGSCYYEPGCANPDYKEYWDLVNAGTVIDFPDDSLCLTKAVFGCTNSNATNYNIDAQVDDGTCIIPGCTNPDDSVNYDSNATINDGSCEDSST